MSEDEAGGVARVEACGYCDGSGVLAEGATCPYCRGVGARPTEIEADPRAPELRAVLAAVLLNRHVRELRVFERAASWFKFRGWPDGDLYVVAVLAVACVHIGAPGQVLLVPAEARGVSSGWTRLLLMGQATAREVVELADLGALLEAG